MLNRCFVIILNEFRLEASSPVLCLLSYIFNGFPMIYHRGHSKCSGLVGLLTESERPRVLELWNSFKRFSCCSLSADVGLIGSRKYSFETEGAVSTPLAPPVSGRLIPSPSSSTSLSSPSSFALSESGFLIDSITWSKSLSSMELRELAIEPFSSPGKKQEF